MNLPSIREFRLSPSRSPNGISCDAAGAFVGNISLLNAISKDGRFAWWPRGTRELSAELSQLFGLPVDTASKHGALTAIANALNKGEIAKAQLVTLHMEIPDPPPLAKTTGLQRDDLARLVGALSACGLLKADWDSDEHPRWPAGAPDSQGGQFAPKGEGVGGSQAGDLSASSIQSDSGQSADSDVKRDDESGVIDAVLRSDRSPSLIPAVAFGGDEGELEQIRYRGDFHDTQVRALSQYLTQHGIPNVTELRLWMADGSARTRIDVMARAGAFAVGVEIKTGKKPFPTIPQLMVYPHVIYGSSVVSPDPKIAMLGFAPRQLLPPMPVYVMYVKEPGARPILKEFDPKKMLEYLKNLMARRATRTPRSP